MHIILGNILNYNYTVSHPFWYIDSSPGYITSRTTFDIIWKPAVKLQSVNQSPPHASETCSLQNCTLTKYTCYKNILSNTCGGNLHKMNVNMKILAPLFTSTLHHCTSSLIHEEWMACSVFQLLFTSLQRQRDIVTIQWIYTPSASSPTPSPSQLCPFPPPPPLYLLSPSPPPPLLHLLPLWWLTIQWNTAETFITFLGSRSLSGMSSMISSTHWGGGKICTHQTIGYSSHQ